MLKKVQYASKLQFEHCHAERTKYDRSDLEQALTLISVGGVIINLCRKIEISPELNIWWT